MEINNDLSKEIFNTTYQIEMSIKEELEKYIVETIYPFCNEISQFEIPKEEIKLAILSYEGRKYFGTSWIPCEKILPEPMKYVLLSTEKRVYIGRLRNDCIPAFYESDSGHMIDNVTGWMELPETYYRG